MFQGRLAGGVREVESWLLKQIRCFPLQVFIAIYCIMNGVVVNIDNQINLADDW